MQQASTVRTGAHLSAVVRVSVRVEGFARILRLGMVAAALVAGCSAVVPADAWGSRVIFRVDEEACPDYGCGDEEPGLSYIADPGENNRPTVTAGPEEGTVTVRDPGAVIRSCRPVSEHEVVCKPLTAFFVSFRLGDGDDFLEVPGRAGTRPADIDQVRVTGGPGDDVLFGSTGDDLIDAGAGADIVRAGRGADVLLDGGSGREPTPDVFDGGAGSDAVNYSERATRVFVDLLSGIGGSDGEGDRLASVEGATGGRGDDLMRAGRVGGTLVGGEGDDRLRGGPGADLLMGETGADRLFGGGGRDTAFGDWPQDDDLGPVPGRDLVHGGTGDDRVTGDAGRDRVFGDAGNDRVYGGDSDEILENDDAADLVFGGSGRDLVSGFLGNDVVHGGPGRDRLRGGPGRDRLEASDRTRDLLDGGPGRDRARVDRRGDFSRLVERFL